MRPGRRAIYTLPFHDGQDFISLRNLFTITAGTGILIPPV